MEAKKFRFFEKKNKTKKTCILLVGYLTRCVKLMLFQPMYHQNQCTKEFIFIPLFLWIFICITIYYVCLYLSVFIYIWILIITQIIINACLNTLIISNTQKICETSTNIHNKELISGKMDSYYLQRQGFFQAFFTTSKRCLKTQFIIRNSFSLLQSIWPRKSRYKGKKHP